MCVLLSIDSKCNLLSSYLENHIEEQLTLSEGVRDLGLFAIFGDFWGIFWDFFRWVLMDGFGMLEMFWMM